MNIWLIGFAIWLAPAVLVGLLILVGVLRTDPRTASPQVTAPTPDVFEDNALHSAADIDCDTAPIETECLASVG